MSLQMASKSHRKADARVVYIGSPEKVSHLEPAPPRAGTASFQFSCQTLYLLALVMRIRIGCFCRLFRYPVIIAVHLLNPVA